MTTVGDAPVVFGGNAEGSDVLDRLEAARIAMRRYFEAAGTSRSRLQALGASERCTI
jgi:hypothetical protein